MTGHWEGNCNFSFVRVGDELGFGHVESDMSAGYLSASLH